MILLRQDTRIAMLVRDETYHWKGWGGKLQLGSGKCRLRIYDLTDQNREGFTLLRPILIVVTDIPGSKMSVRSCTSHIVTSAVRDFGLDRHRMLWVEHYPGTTYGANHDNRVPERFDAVEFTWHGGEAIKPVWRELQSSMRDAIKELLESP
jgi:hypothetical protein